MLPELDSGYRAYVLDQDDQILSRHEFEAGNTTLALETARQWLNRHDVEVWQRTHVIGRLKSST